jgi:hypothetical protein
MNTEEKILLAELRGKLRSKKDLSIHELVSLIRLQGKEYQENQRLLSHQILTSHIPPLTSLKTN